MEIEKRDNYKLIEEIGKMLTKHITSSSLPIDDLYSICKLFVNGYLPCIKLQQLAMDWLYQILKAMSG